VAGKNGGHTSSQISRPLMKGQRRLFRSSLDPYPVSRGKFNTRLGTDRETWAILRSLENNYSLYFEGYLGTAPTSVGAGRNGVVVKANILVAKKLLSKRIKDMGARR